MTIKRIIRIYYAASFALSACLAALAVAAYINLSDLVEGQRVRLQSYMLADELRQSSDDLTRFARTYCLTGEPKYEQYYRDVLAIRDGRKPRPEKYQHIYWDFVTGEARAVKAATKAEPLKALMLELGFTAAELAKLTEAQANSDELAKTEEKAMNAAKGRFAGKDGKFTLAGAPDKALATRLLYDAAYHKEKARIMQPIDEFLDLMDARTASTLAKYDSLNSLYLRLILGILLLLGLLLAGSYRLLHSVVIKPVTALQRQTREVAADLDRLAGAVKEIPQGGLREAFSAQAKRLEFTFTSEIGELARLHDGMIGRLQEMGAAVTEIIAGLSRSNEALKEEDASLRRAEEALADSHAELRSVLDAASLVSIIATDLDGKITLFNRGAEKLLGYKAEELIGLKTPQDIHLRAEMEARARELSSYLKRPVAGFEAFVALARGGAFDKREWTYVRKDGQQVPVELTVTGIKDHAGKLTGFLGVGLDISERKRSEIEMRKLWRSVEASPVSIVITNKSGEIEYSNPKFTEITGYSQEEALGKNPRILKSGDTPEEVYRSLWSEITAGREWRGELRNKKKNGELFWEEASISPVNDAAGNITHFVAVKEDITERKRNQDAVRESEERYKDLFENSRNLIQSVTPEGKFIYVNPAWLNTLGYSAEETASLNVLDIIHPDCREHCLRMFKDCLKGEPLQDIEAVFIARNGQRVDVLGSSSCQFKDGRPYATRSIFTNITERKRAQDALRESEDKLRLILDSAAEAIYGIDLQGKCTFCNASCVRMLGYDSQGDLLGKNLHELIHHSREDGTSLPAGECRIHQAFRKGEGTHVFDEVLWRRDGTFFPVEYWSHPQLSAGKTIGAVVTFMDISLRRRAQKEIESARDAAVRLARLKSEFLANMSHEIRTPMNAIIGMTGLLQGTPLSAQQRDYVSTVNNAGEALLDLINDILDFSKIESGMLSLEKTEFSVMESVEKTIDLIAPRAHGKGIELAFLVDEGVPGSVSGDPGRLRQVLLNLLSNAVKFTEKGEVLLSVKTESETDKTTVLRFSVKDTGIGISAEAGGRLFQVFSQADASTTRKYGGTGLGLAISKKLVELMGGSIGMESVPGEGSTFWFSLPFGKAAHSAPAFRPAPDGLEGVRALIVDDNAVNRQIVSHYLASWKLRPEEVSSGEAALAGLKKAAGSSDPFRVVILDMQMPEMDGLMLAQRMQQDPELSGIRKVLMTSLGLPLNQEEAEVFGIARCLSKPFRPSSLFEALSSALGAEPLKRVVPKPGAEAGAQREAASGDFRILVAEDNPVNQKVALMQLQKAGYKADVAANGLEAVAAVKRSHYDLVLMDCQMPEMDGFQATAEIRKLGGEKSRLPIIAMTANALEGDREKCLAAGMDDYLSKPVRLETLLELVGKWDAVLDDKTMSSLMESAGDEAPAFLSELVDIYLRDASLRLAVIRSAASGGDAAGLAAAAHALKGASANLGARRVEALCRRLEGMGRAGALEGAADLANALAREAELLKAALLAEREKHPQGGRGTAQ